MSGPNPPGDLPPDLPPEYAEAYRRGYQRAYPQDAGEEEAEEPQEPEETARLESLESAFRPVPPPGGGGPVHRAPDEPERRRLLAPLMLVGLALLLVLTAYGIGRVFSGQVDSADTSPPEPDGVVLGEDDDPASGETQKAGQPQRKKYDGQVSAAAIGGAAASCQSDSGVDAAGRPVGYEPANVYDGDLTTAWRCDGRGVGVRVTMNLPETITIGEVGMVPGYAKTDPSNGVDRYAENNRITRARWIFSDGTSVVQKLDGSAGNRSMQTIRIPKTKSNEVEIEILGSTRGKRNTVAISEVTVGEVAQ